MAFYGILSPLTSTGYLGTNDTGTNPCTQEPIPDSAHYWHISKSYNARAFDIASQPSGGGGTVYARFTSGLGIISEVGARAASYADGSCGVDVDIVSATTPGIIRRVRYYHVKPTQELLDGAGEWVAIGSLPANGSCSIEIGSIWETGACASADGWAHVHVDTAQIEDGSCSGGSYEWVNNTLKKNVPGSPSPIEASTVLFQV